MDPQRTQWAESASQREAQLLSIVEELQAQVQELRQRQTKRQVLPEPDRFTGRAKDWDTWAVAMVAKLRIDGSAIGGNEAQFFYVYNSLDMKVQGLVLSFVQSAQEKEEWEPLALIDQLKRIFDDPNKMKKAGQRLIELRQGAMAVAVYLPLFEKTMFEAGANTWPDNAKITALVGGLNKYTRQRVDAQLTIPADYDGFVQMLRMLGNQFGSSYVYGNGTNGNGNGSSSSAMEWEPVVAAAKTAHPTSREQRQEWRDKGKCVRCGSGKHWVGGCPLRPAHGRSLSFSSESSSGNEKGNGYRNGSGNGKSKALVVATVRTKTTAKRSRSQDEWEDF